MVFELKIVILVFLNVFLIFVGEKILLMVWDYMICLSCVGVKLILVFKGLLILIKS